MQTKNNLYKYFDSVTYSGLAAALPATIIIVFTFLVIIITGNSIGKLKIVEARLVQKAFILISLSALLGVIVCLWDIVRLQTSEKNEIFAYRKSLYNAALIFINTAYAALVFLIVEFSKIGNIPVGRD